MPMVMCSRKFNATAFGKRECVRKYFTECGFPNAVGLKYIDEGSEEPVLLLQRNEKFTPPADGWQKDGRVYIPQEVVATTPTAGTFTILS